MKTVISIIIILTAGVLYAQTQNKELDEKTFHINLKLIKGKKVQGSKWSEDNISFKSGNLIPEFMQEHEHFPPAPCQMNTNSSKVISFSATHKNPNGSEIRWEGTINGNTIKGTAVWTNMHGPRTYSFTGTLKGK